MISERRPMTDALRAKCILCGMPNSLDEAAAWEWLQQGCNFSDVYQTGYPTTWEGARESERVALEIGLIDPPKYPNVSKSHDPPTRYGDSDV